MKDIALLNILIGFVENLVELKERQIIAKFFGCKTDLMDSANLLKIVIQATNASNMHLTGNPQVVTVDDEEYGGVSILALIIESHLALHTWPKFKHVWVDIATCGKGIPKKGIELISNYLSADEVKIEYDSTNNLELMK